MKQLWYGGNIYTMEKEGATVEAVLTENEKIIAIGSFQDLKFAADKWNDLQGTSLYPGFVDSHCHLLFMVKSLADLT